MRKILTVVIILLLVAYASLKIYNQFFNQTAEEGLPASADLPSEFIEFYRQFHRDSLFQINHIQFPLEGLPSLADSQLIASKSFKWEREDWEMHRSLAANNGEYKQFFVQSIPNRLIEERIQETRTGLVMVRRFLKQDEDWELIYYAGLNRLRE